MPSTHPAGFIARGVLGPCRMPANRALCADIHPLCWTTARITIFGNERAMWVSFCFKRAAMAHGGVARLSSTRIPRHSGSQETEQSWRVSRFTGCDQLHRTPAPEPTQGHGLSGHDPSHCIATCLSISTSTPELLVPYTLCLTKSLLILSVLTLLLPMYGWNHSIAIATRHGSTLFYPTHITLAPGRFVRREA